MIDENAEKQKKIDYQKSRLKSDRKLAKNGQKKCTELLKWEPHKNAIEHASIEVNSLAKHEGNNCAKIDQSIPRIRNLMTIPPNFLSFSSNFWYSFEIWIIF